jgi:hypothetical protein
MARFSLRSAADFFSNVKARGIENLKLPSSRRLQPKKMTTAEKSDLKDEFAKITKKTDKKPPAEQHNILSTELGVPKADVKAKMEDPAVKAAAETKKSDLAKLGLKGAAGVTVLMILTGETNPITAIKKAVEATSDAAQKGLGIFGDLLDFFSNYGMYISLASSCLVMLLVSVMLLK